MTTTKDDPTTTVANSEKGCRTLHRVRKSGRTRPYEVPEPSRIDFGPETEMDRQEDGSVGAKTSRKTKPLEGRKALSLSSLKGRIDRKNRKIAALQQQVYQMRKDMRVFKKLSIRPTDNPHELMVRVSKIVRKYEPRK